MERACIHATQSEPNVWTQSHVQVQVHRYTSYRCSATNQAFGATMKWCTLSTGFRKSCLIKSMPSSGKAPLHRRIPALDRAKGAMHVEKKGTWGEWSAWSPGAWNLELRTEHHCFNLFSSCALNSSWNCNCAIHSFSASRCKLFQIKIQYYIYIIYMCVCMKYTIIYILNI